MQLIKAGNILINLETIAWAKPLRDAQGVFTVEIHFAAGADIASDALVLKGPEAHKFMVLTRPLLFVIDTNGEGEGKES